MKFRCVDEFEQLSFDDSPIVSFQMSEDEVTFTFGGATVKAGNSQNGRFQDMYCGEITLTLLQAQMKRLVKEGMMLMEICKEKFRMKMCRNRR